MRTPDKQPAHYRLTATAAASAAPAPRTAAEHLLRREALLLGSALILSSALSMGLLAMRMLYSGQITYRFLNWNLFLAWIPLGLALAAWLLQGEARRPRLRVLPLLALWLLFLPNAPYLLTDLIHLAHRPPVPLWFDLLLLLSYAWNGLILGYLSLRLVQALFQRWMGAAAGWLAATAAIGLAAFGIYLGRFERWNSWDIFTDPFGVLATLFAGLANPATQIKPLAVTLLLGGILFAIYATVGLLSHADPMAGRHDANHRG